MKNLIFILLALPLLATAQERAVQVPYSCGAGNEFTISIPVKFPKHITTVQYAWYRNDTLIAGTQRLLMPDEKIIAYTIPADKAHGDNVAYHFKYCLNDECSDVWTRSPQYVITFWSCPLPQVSAITGSTAVCSGQSVTYSVANVTGTTYDWELPGGWTKTAGGTTHSITVTASTAGGTVSVTPSNNCGTGTSSELAVAVSAALTRSGGAASQTVCSNTAITNIAYTRSGSATGFAASWSPSSPAGIIGSISGSTYTISGTPTAIGAYTYTMNTSGGSCAATATGTITRGGVSTTSTISVAAYTCSGGISSTSTISVAAYSTACTSGVSGSINTISVDAYTQCTTSNNGIGSVNTIDVSAAN